MPLRGCCLPALSHYVKEGVQKVDQEELTPLLRLKYHDSIADAADLGKTEDIGRVFARL
jgi:type I restriction enzyme, R subunit